MEGAWSVEHRHLLPEYSSTSVCWRLRAILYKNKFKNFVCI